MDAVFRSNFVSPTILDLGLTSPVTPCKLSKFVEPPTCKEVAHSKYRRWVKVRKQAEKALQVAGDRLEERPREEEKISVEIKKKESTSGGPDELSCGATLWDRFEKGSLISQGLWGHFSFVTGSGNYGICGLVS